MIGEYGATISKHRLSARLAALRADAGMRVEEAAAKAGSERGDGTLAWDEGKVRRIEARRWTTVTVADVLALLRVYSPVPAVRNDIEALAARCQVRCWWRDYGTIFGNDYPGFENDAATIREFTPLLLPAQLQTPAYTRALARAATRSPDWRRHAADATARRQRVLTRQEPEPPEFTVVITEAALRCRFGSLTDRRTQVLHLAQASRRLPEVFRARPRLRAGTPGHHRVPGKTRRGIG